MREKTHRLDERTPCEDCVDKEKITSYLAFRPDVTLAFLFGSFSKEKGRRSSDVDLTVYLRQPYAQADVRAIWTDLEDLAHRDVDLVVLNDALPGIAWAAMKRIFQTGIGTSRQSCRRAAHGPGRPGDRAADRQHCPVPQRRRKEEGRYRFRAVSQGD